MSRRHFDPRDFSRREFIRTSLLGSAAIASGALVGCAGAAEARGKSPAGPASCIFPLNQDWLFGGKFNPGATAPSFADKSFSKVTLPHCVSKLSWQGWHPAEWQNVWTYRRHFSCPAEFASRRVFLDFDGVMNTARPAINGRALPEHAGGYLPFNYEITRDLRHGKNVLAVAIDSRWNAVPPEGAPEGSIKVDYLEPGGIVRGVSLRAVPQIFISDVFAKPVNVLDPARRVEVLCTVDAAMVPQKPLRLRVELMDGAQVLSIVETSVSVDKPGATECKLTLANLGNIRLWDVDAPELYQVVATLLLDGKPLHDYRSRIGFRDARFEVDGFFLNGRRFRLFGLDRHEIFPYVGFAMPSRVMRKDAEILRREFNCNAVRCSHYPQTAAFLDACDELGLLVWEEVPGWQFLGDAAWGGLVINDVKSMILRDRNRPSIMMWGVRVNESANDTALYERTTALAKSLDDSRPASGSMTPDSRTTWKTSWREDVFAFDDYHSAPDGSVGIDAPLPGVPYMLAEAVGQFSYGPGRGNFVNKYRRAGDVLLQTQQAIFHAQAHDRAAGFDRMAGVIAWCAYDYSSQVNPYDVIKCPGVADVFRIPKLGASFYQAQVSPKVKPVIQPNFYWDFGPRTAHGPDAHAAIFSNCDRLEVFVDGNHLATALPDKANYPHLKYPPFFCDLEIEKNSSRLELRIDGYVGNQIALSRSFSADKSKDQLLLLPDDMELVGDGIDATRLVFKIVDKYGADRACLIGDCGEILFEITGPGEIVGDNPFTLLDESGGVGAVWIRTKPGGSGEITVKATHSTLGAKSATLKVQRDSTFRKI